MVCFSGERCFMLFVNSGDHFIVIFELFGTWGPQGLQEADPDQGS